MFSGIRAFFSSTESEARKVAQENEKMDEVKRRNAKEDSLANLELYTPKEIRERIQRLTDTIVSNHSSFSPEAVSITLPIVIDLLGLDMSYDGKLADMKSGLVADLDADSLDSVEIILNMEKALTSKQGGEVVEISDEEAEGIYTIGAVIELMNKKLKMIAETM